MDVQLVIAGNIGSAIYEVLRCPGFRGARMLQWGGVPKLCLLVCLVLLLLLVSEQEELGSWRILLSLVRRIGELENSS